MRSKRKLTALAAGLGLLSIPGGFAQEKDYLSLKDVPMGTPTAIVIDAGDPPPPGTIPATIAIPGPDKNLPFQDLVAAGIVRDRGALVRLGKALFWDMQTGSDGVQACASCHFNAGADNRSKNQISPGLHDTNFVNTFISGDNTFGNATVPYTANDPHTPNPPGPRNAAPADLDVPGFPHFAPNHQLTFADFPLNGWLRPTEQTPRGPRAAFLDEFANVSRDTNDVISSQGVRHTIFTSVTPGNPVDKGTPEKDIYNLATPGLVNTKKLVRRVPPRNAPPVIDAVFNFDNFWDGRASFIFNGVNPFGFRDRLSTLMRVENGQLKDVYLRVTNASLASQAVGPTTSNFEMSWENRTFPDVGKKMLPMRPLAKQLVHPEDSVLGPLARAHLGLGGRLGGREGLSVPTYADMVHEAFREEWWSSPVILEVENGSVVMQNATTGNPRTMARNGGRAHPMYSGAPRPDHLAANEYTQAQWNFSMFWGLAIQAYESTLIADETPYDRFQGSEVQHIKGDPKALTESQRNGLTIFNDTDPNLGAKCNNCHKLPVATNHSVIDIVQETELRNPNFQGRPTDIIEYMAMGDGGTANYDKGFYNISVRRSSEDVGRDDTAPGVPLQPPFQNPLDDKKSPFPLSYVKLGQLAQANKLPPDVLRFVQLDPKTLQPVPVLDRLAIHGNFKVPNLRNVKFTGPYFHNGDSATLRQVVEFYTRGGNFPNTNFHDLDPDIEGIPPLRFPEFLPSSKRNMHDLIDFVAEGLADPRVAHERAPFDHPQIRVPNGTEQATPGVDDTIDVPAVGRHGRPKPIDTFLNLDPQMSTPHGQQPITAADYGRARESK
jgi:cytochrome c peroxidase